VIEAIGEWVEALPSEFLSDSYLKYLAWALSDRAPLVRLQAIKALTKLYSDG
jgi:cohesin complex subunit SA-1/2